MFFVKRKFKLLFHELLMKNNLLLESYSKVKFQKRMGYYLNVDNPKTFNEKIQFRKLFDSSPLYSLCSDKYRVREYVKEKIGEEHLIPLHLVTKEITKDHWENLPDRFVAKANHNSGPVQIVKDKKNDRFEKVYKNLNKQLKEKYGTISLEKYYNDIEPLITIEKFLVNSNGEIPEDYKFHCFNNGEKIFIQLDSSRYKNHKQDFFDEQWKPIELEVLSSNSKISPKKPENLKALLNIAKKLSEDFDYVRVDLYNLDGKIYFGELTFCPWGGLTKFKQFSWDKKWGELWKQKIS